MRCTALFNRLTLITLAITYNGYAETPSLDDIQKAASQRAKNIQLPDTMEVSVWANQTLTQNPGYFNFDSKGRMFMAEIDRIGKGVDDIRGYPVDMTIEDIQIETLADRIAMYQNHAERVPMSYYKKGSDQIRLIQDSNNDGVADTSQIFATGFNDTLDGLGADVIEREGKVYYTNIPNLWVLEDNNQDGVAEKREAMFTGFGTRVSFMGHDMHGLTWGPDGKLYWSLGDRGYDVKTKEGKHFFGPNLGAVFRANPDGSEMELFYTGLRNPQELVFDEYGNLFTADNDGDKSDIERINHLIEGGDSGWHAGHQTLMSFSGKLDLRSYKYTNDTDVPVSWLVNDMSRPRNPAQPAFMLPGIGELYTGPSGFAYNPSNYLGEDWRNSFFVALYGGNADGSRISTFKTQPNGASFLTTEIVKTISGFNATDVDFGPDGRLYMSEFNYSGWSSKNEGTIYAVDLKNPSPAYQQQTKAYQQILTSDFKQKSNQVLTELLATDHQHIRQRAQFELARRGLPAYTLFKQIAFNEEQNLFARIHSIWGIGQLAHQKDIGRQSLKSLLPLLQDKTEQIRIQTARVLGDNRFTPANPALIAALSDSSPQVRMYAALGLGRIGDKASVPHIIESLKAVQDKDLWLRHSLVMGLKGINKKHWIEYKKSESDSIRLAVLLALRMLKDKDISYFLNDPNPAIFNEAVIAISDKQVVEVRPELAQKLSANLPATSEPQAYIHHRLINANYNQGDIASAKRLIEYASSELLPERLVSEALAALEAWNEVHPIDTITGLPTQANLNRADIKSEITAQLANILNSATGQASVQAMRLAEQYDYKIPAKTLIAIVQNQAASSEIRLQSLSSLKAQNNSELFDLSVSITQESKPKIVKAGLANIFDVSQVQGLTLVESYLKGDSLTHKKVGLSFLTEFNNSKTDKLIIDYMQKLLAKQLPTGLILELLDAAKTSSNNQIQNLYQMYNQQLSGQDLMTQYASTLEGGDIEAGKALFFGGGAAQCMRCHRVNGQGQSRVGPDLTGLATRYQADYILQALIEPSAAIAPYFGRFTLTLKTGEQVTGNFVSENESAVTLENDKNLKTEYLKSDIKDIARPMSGMPPMGYILNKHQIRDLVAYLKTLTKEKRTGGH